MISDASTTQGAICNTPPLNTQPEQIPKENRIVLDWLEFTMPDEFRCQSRYLSLRHYIRIPGASFVTAPRGLHGYKTQLLYGKVKVLLDGSDGMGVHVIISGSALREMTADPLNLLHWLLHHRGKVTRIDLALDDVTGTLTLSRMNRALRAGAVSCRAKGYRSMRSGSVSTGQVTGETLYFGSAQSRTQYRIYDKAAEQGIEGHWVRCEGQYRSDNAHQVAQMIHRAGFDIGPVFCGLLRGYLSVLSPSKTDSNKSRWKTAAWWLDLLQGAEKLKLSILKAAPSLERARNWLKRQVATSLAMVYEGYGPEAIKDIYQSGKARMTKEQRRLCAIPF